MSNPNNEHIPTDVQRGQVEAMTGFGITQDDIAIFLDVDPKTLRKHYPRELAIGKVKANTKVAQRLFQHATGDSVAAAIFWMKAQAGWRETQVVAFTEDDTQAELEAARDQLKRLLTAPAPKQDEANEPDE